MTEQELIEKLAKRIYSIDIRMMEDNIEENIEQYDWETEAPKVKDGYYALARETLRQMKWAYAVGVDEGSDTSSFWGGQQGRANGLERIAPDDFKP